MKLYTHPFTRGASIVWWVQELQAQGKGSNIEIVTVDFTANKHKEPDYLKINPFGRIPALEDGDLKLFESGAITMYIGEVCGAAGLDTPQGRAAANKWVLFTNSTLAEALFGQHEDKEAQMPLVLSALDKVLEGKSFLENDEFGVADVAVGGCLLHARDGLKMKALADYKNIDRYINEMVARPAQTLNSWTPDCQ
jgi:glutathione S-transferase